jgi:Holliday junction resolvase-like predicted endonuclease
MQQKWLYEDDVVDAVCGYLELHGYTILQKCSSKVKGVDIIAKSAGGETFHVEAKGETSKVKTSKRYDKPFRRGQCHVHVAEAFFTAAATTNTASKGTRSAMAFPDTPYHREFVGRLQHALATLRIAVFWVGPKPDCVVHVEPPLA